MKIVPLFAAAAAALLAVPAASAATATPAKATVAAPAGSEMQRHDRRWSHGRERWRTVCKTTWRHHRKVRTCRKVRTHRR